MASSRPLFESGRGEDEGRESLKLITSKISAVNAMMKVAGLTGQY